MKSAVVSEGSAARAGAGGRGAEPGQCAAVPCCKAMLQGQGSIPGARGALLSSGFQLIPQSHMLLWA